MEAERMRRPSYLGLLSRFFRKLGEENMTIASALRHLATVPVSAGEVIKLALIKLVGGIEIAPSKHDWARRFIFPDGSQMEFDLKFALDYAGERDLERNYALFQKVLGISPNEQGVRVLQ